MALEPGNSGEPRLSRADRAAIARFSARWSVRFEPLLPGERRPAGSALPNIEDPGARAIEALLERARLALARLDEAEAREALAQAEQAIHDSPALAQAAWLLAEQLTIAAELAEQGGDANEAARLRQRALSLEGPRAAPFREGASNTGLELDETPQALTVDIRGLDGRDVLEWDGVRVVPPIRAFPGEHAARVLRRGEVIWAGWVSADERGSPLVLPVPEVPPCSHDDLAATRDGATAPSAEAGVLCARWAVARRSRGVLEIARCQRSTCGPFEALEPEPKPPVSPTRRPSAATRGLPTWATWALAGAGAALATSLVLWQTGAFDSSPGRERWVYRGLEP